MTQKQDDNNVRAMIICGVLVIAGIIGIGPCSKMFGTSNVNDDGTYKQEYIEEMADQYEAAH